MVGKEGGLFDNFDRIAGTDCYLLMARKLRLGAAHGCKRTDRDQLTLCVGQYIASENVPKEVRLKEIVLSRAEIVLMGATA